MLRPVGPRNAFDSADVSPAFGLIGVRTAQVVLQCTALKERFIAKTQQNTWAKKIREQEAKRKAEDKLLKRQFKRDNQRDGNLKDDNLKDDHG